MFKHSTSTLALCVALLLIYSLSFQSLPASRGGLVLAKAGTAAEKNPGDAQQAQSPSGEAQRQELKLSGSAAQPSRTPDTPNVPNVVTIVATNRDSFPNHGDGKAHENDAIDYAIAITNTGDTDATGVSFTDVVDGNTSTLVGGATIQFRVIADPYSALGNDTLDTTTIAAGSGQTVLENDTLNGATLTGFGDTLTNANNVVPNGTNTVTTTNGGTVKMNATGSFIYNPAPGFGGAGVTDTFWYTLTNNTIGTGNPNGFPRGSARVTINVSTPIWFINSAAAVGGNGTLASPFNCYTGTSNGVQTCFSDTAADDPGDPIFLYNGSYTGGYALLANEKLIGQGSTASLGLLTGATVPPGNTALPTTNGNPANVTITTTVPATNAIPVSAGGILLRGFTVGNTTGAKIFGSSFGTLTVGDNASPDVVLNGAGQALNLTTGTFAATSGFNSVTTTSSGSQGINLAGIAGTVSFGSTTVSGNVTQCILIGTTTAAISFGNTSCTAGTDGVSFQNNSAGTRTFGTLSVSGNSAAGFLSGAGGGNVTVNGAASFNSAGNNIDIQNLTNPSTINFASTVTVNKTTIGGFGVNLVSNTGSTITFNSLGITTANGPALNATGGGTINVTNATAAISATGLAAQTAAAILGNGVALNSNFSSVSCNGSGTGGNCISLTTVTGTSNFGSGTLTGAAGATFLVSGGTASVTYAGGITQANNAPAVSVAGGHSGTLTFNTGTISATNGTGLQFDNADGTYNFNGTNTLNGGDAGIDIQNGSASTFVFSSNTSINNPSGIAYREDTSTPNVTYNGTITKTNNANSAVSINAHTANTSTFTGSITASTTTANAINLTGNTGGTITFTGGLNLTTSSGVGLNATGGGTVNATQNNGTIVNTVTTTGGSGVNMTSTTIGASGITFRSISSVGGTTPGINLNTTGSTGVFVVSGNGASCTSAATCTGGSISGKTGASETTGTPGVRLVSVSNIRLTRMNISGNNHSGIYAGTVSAGGVIGAEIINGFQLETCNIENNGDSLGSNPDETGVDLYNLQGTAIGGANPTSINNTRIQNNKEVELLITNISGTLTDFQMNNDTISSNNNDTANPHGDLVGFLNRGPAGVLMTLNVVGGSYTGFTGNNNPSQLGTTANGIFADTSGGSMTANVSGATFDHNNVGVGVSTAGTGNLTFDIHDNPAITQSRSHALNLFVASDTTGTVNGKFRNNVIGTNGVASSGSDIGFGIRVQNEGLSTVNAVNVTISGNTVQEFKSTSGINVNHGLNTNPSSKSTNVTITGNTVRNITSGVGTGNLRAIIIQQNNTTAPGIVCANISGNTLTNIEGNTGDGTRIRLRQLAGGTFNVTQTDVNNLAAVNGSTVAQISLSGTITFNQPACSQPPIANGDGDLDAINHLEGVPALQKALITPSATTSSATQQVPAQIVKAPQAAREVKQAMARENNSSAVATAVPSNRTSRNDVRMAHAPRRSSAPGSAFRNTRLEDTTPNSPTTGGTVGPVALGTVAAGSSVVLTFQVVINTKAPLGAVTISNQGTVSGSNFATVNGVPTNQPNTDDPDIVGAANPTITPIVHPSAADGTITGRITDDQGNPVEGTVVRLAGAQTRKFITDANGVYRFEQVETSGFYTVTPSRVNYTFSPSSRSFSQIGETTQAAFGATTTGQHANPLDTPEYFVRQHYVDFLGREPDEAGFNFWSDQILECGNDNVCTDRRRENVSAAYFFSIEFQQTGGLVDGLYKASYGAHPEFAQFMPDTRAVGQGVVVGRAGWEALLKENKRTFAEAFVNRAAFHAAYDGMDNSLFVDTLIANTGVSFTAGERDALGSGLAGGTMTRADVVRSIAENNHFVNAKFNEVFVMMEYFGYLRRDADSSGFQFWLSKLNQFGGNFEQAEMVKAFIVSGEFRDRFPR